LTVFGPAAYAGAITGAVRGDYFWGTGEEAANNAGLMKSAGQW
jgi:membrane-bound lytic murein transglycosylase A